MQIKFSPSGQLDIATDPVSLPQEVSGKTLASGAMTRCVNLRLDRPGCAETRMGASRESTQFATPMWLMAWMDGDRYEFAGTGIYKNGTLLESGLTSAAWSAAVYYPYSSTTQSLFCCNGTDIKRISGGSVYNWGISAPSTAPGFSGDVPIAYTFTWESDTTHWINYRDTVSESYTNAFESDYVATDDPFYNFMMGNMFGGDYLYTDGMELAGGDHIINPYLCIAAYNWENAYAETYIPYQAYLGDVVNIRKWTENESSVDYAYTWEQTQIVGGVAYYDTPYDYVFQFWNEIGVSGDQDFRVKYTYCRKVDGVLENESNPSPASTTTSVKGAFYVTWPVPSDSQISHVKIYRTLAGGADFYYAGEFLASLGSGIVAVADEELGALVETDHNPPPSGAHLVIGPSNDGYLMLVVGNLLYYSKPKQPEYWPTDYYIDLCPPDETVLAYRFFSGVLYLVTDRDVYQVTGSSPTSFFPLNLNIGAGTKSRQCFLGSRATGLVRLWHDGIYQYTGGRDVTISEPFSPLFGGHTRHSTPGMDVSLKANCWLVQYGDRFYFGYPSNVATYPDNILVWDASSKRICHYQYGVEFSYAVVDPENGWLLAADSDGYVWRLEQEHLTTDNHGDIAWDLQTKDFAWLRKNFPRHARYDVELVNGASAAAHIQLDDAVKQTHTLRTSRATKQRLIEGCTGDRLSIRITGTGPVIIHSAEVQ